MNPLLFIGLGIAILSFLMKKKDEVPEEKPDGPRYPTPPVSKPLGEQTSTEKITAALAKIKAEFGVDIATNVERMYREETAHFTSGQFQQSFSPGMERHGENYPWGWTSMKEFWDLYPELKPTGFYVTPENKTGITKQFIKFPNVYAAMKSLSLYLKKYRPGRWFSLHVPDQIGYEQRLAAIKPKIVASLA